MSTDIIKYIRIELIEEDVEKILHEYITKKFGDEGYMLDYMQREGPIPDILYRGKKK